MISCFSSWSRFRNDAEHCEHGCDPSTDMLGLMELPRFSSISSSLILLDECVDVGVCCWCNGCCWCCCSRWCFMKKSAGTFSLSPVKPDTNDGTRDARENDKQIYKIIARFHLLQNSNQRIFIKKIKERKAAGRWPTHTTYKWIDRRSVSTKTKAKILSP